MANSAVYLQAWFAYRSIAGEMSYAPGDPPTSLTKTANVRNDYTARSTTVGQPDQNLVVSNPVPTDYPWQAGHPEFNYCWLYAVVLYEVLDPWGQPGSCTLTIPGVGTWTAGTTGAPRDVVLYLDTGAGTATSLDDDPGAAGPNLWPTVNLTATGNAVPPGVLNLSATGPGAAFVTWSGGTDGQSLVPGTSYSIGAALSSPLYRISSMTLDGSPSANPAAFVGDSNDHTVVAITETETRIINLSLTLQPSENCPAGSILRAVSRQGHLLVSTGAPDGMAILSTVGQQGQDITINSTVPALATDTSVNILCSGASNLQRVKTLTVNGVQQVGDNTSVFMMPVTLTPGVTDVAVAAVITTDAACEPTGYDPERRACPEGTVWNGTTCIPIDDGSHGCPPGTAWDPTVQACVALPPVCPPGTYWNGTACVSLPADPPRPQCPPGTYWNGTACVAYTTPCPPGTHWNGTACVPDVQPCPPGTVYNPVTGACDPIVPPIEGDTTGSIEVRARLNGEWVQARCDMGGTSQVTPYVFTLVAPGSYTVSASFESPSTSQAFSSSRSVVVVAGQTSYVQFDWYEHMTGETGSNEIQVYAHAGPDDVMALIRVQRTSPDIDVSGNSPFALAIPAGSDGSFTITGNYNGLTRTASVTTIAPGVGESGQVYVVHLYFPAVELPGAGEVTDPQPPTDYDSDDTGGFTVCWQDDGGIWKKRHVLHTGAPGSTKPERTMHQLGAYRTRRYEFEHTARKPLVLVGVEEDVEVLK